MDDDHPVVKRELGKASERLQDRPRKKQRRDEERETIDFLGDSD